MSETKKTYFVIIVESAAKSWLRDSSTFVLFVALIGIGWALQSSALQWVGAIVGFVIIAAKGSGRSKSLTKEDALKFISEMSDEG